MGSLAHPLVKSLPPKPLIPLFFDGAEDSFIRIPKKPGMSYKGWITPIRNRYVIVETRGEFNLITCLEYCQVIQR